VTPLQSAAGEVDPVQRLANQHAQELALIQQFEQQGVLAHENALALRNAADTQYEQQRIAAQWEIYRNQSQANELLASSLEGLQSGASSALTGLINGTQSLQEAFANIGSTILNSVITSLVQMGIEWVKAQLMGQAAAAASLASTMARLLRQLLHGHPLQSAHQLQRMVVRRLLGRLPTPVLFYLQRVWLLLAPAITAALFRQTQCTV
jgi:hypothetical protein